jgi:glycerol-3-phosphate dehydrogenase
MTPTPARATRQRSLEKLASENWDVVVIGGGVTGVATLLEATERGLKAALVERDDICAETSSRSSKLVHGGLRYLEQFQFRLVHQALVERSRFLRDVPHLVHIEKFLIPIHGSPLNLPYIGAGLLLYDLLGAASGVGHTTVCTPSAVLAHAPSVRRRGLRGGFIYHDAVMDDARLGIALLRTALGLGATALTRVEATEFSATSQSAIVAACDGLSGRAVDIKAGAVIDATGASGNFAPRGGAGADSDGVLRSRGVHIVIERDAIPADVGMTLRVPGRVVFVIPWHGAWLVGTTDVPQGGDARRPQATDEEVEYLLETLRQALDAPVARSAVIATFAGIRPLAAPRTGVNSVQASREHRIDRPADRLIRIRGGKYTTARVMAAEAVDLVAGKQRRVGERAPIAGALAASDRAAFVTKLSDRFGIDATIADGVADRHGREAEDVLELGAQQGLLAPLGAGLDAVEAEVPWAAREELATSVDDFLARRTRLSLVRRDHGLKVAARVAELLRPELGWSAADATRSVEEYRHIADREYGLPAHGLS